MCILGVIAEKDCVKNNFLFLTQSFDQDRELLIFEENFMNCGVCRPYCSKCKPPMEKPLFCSHCGTYTFRLKAIDNKCKKCGSQLPKPVYNIVKCLYSGMLCANPCGKSKKQRLDGIARKCLLNTPPPDGAVT